MRYNVLTFFVSSLILNECYGMSRDFFGTKSVENCEDVQNNLKSCSEELAELRATGKCREPRAITQLSPCDTYLKRFLNLLLISVSLKDRHLIDGERVAVMMPLTFSSESLRVLKSFSHDYPHDFSWVQLDESLATMFEKLPSTQTETPGGKNSLDGDDGSFTRTPTNPIVIIIAVVGSLVVTVLYLVLMEQSLVRTIFIGSVIVFGLSLGWTWHLEVRKETDKGLMTLRKITAVPDYCFQSNDGLWSQLAGAFSGNKENTCRKYHEALMYEPWTRVSFVKVFTLTLSGLFLESLPLLGQKLGQMIFNLNSELGFVPSLFGGLTSSLILPPLIILATISFFSNAFTTSLWALLSHGRSSPPSQPRELSISQPEHPLTSTGQLSPKPTITSRQCGQYRKLHESAKKKVAIRYRNRPRIKVMRSISSPQFTAVDE